MGIRGSQSQPNSSPLSLVRGPSLTGLVDSATIASLVLQISPWAENQANPHLQRWHWCCWSMWRSRFSQLGQKSEKSPSVTSLNINSTPVILWPGCCRSKQDHGVRKVHMEQCKLAQPKCTWWWGLLMIWIRCGVLPELSCYICGLGVGNCCVVVSLQFKCSFGHIPVVTAIVLINLWALFHFLDRGGLTEDMFYTSLITHTLFSPSVVTTSSNIALAGGV